MVDADALFPYASVAVTSIVNIRPDLSVPFRHASSRTVNE